jgi:hypothetical protein
MIIILMCDFMIALTLMNSNFTAARLGFNIKDSSLDLKTKITLPKLVMTHYNIWNKHTITL